MENVDHRPSQEEQIGLSRIETFAISAARSRFARGMTVVLGLGSCTLADYLMQTPVQAQIEQVEVYSTQTLTETPTSTLPLQEELRKYIVPAWGIVMLGGLLYGLYLIEHEGENKFP